MSRKPSNISTNNYLTSLAAHFTEPTQPLLDPEGGSSSLLIPPPAHTSNDASVSSLVTCWISSSDTPLQTTQGIEPQQPSGSEAATPQADPPSSPTRGLPIIPVAFGDDITSLPRLSVDYYNSVLGILATINLWLELEALGATQNRGAMSSFIPHHIH